MTELAARTLRISSRGDSSDNNGPDALIHPKGTPLLIQFTALEEDGETPFAATDVTKLTVRGKNAGGSEVFSDELLAGAVNDSVTAAAYAAGTGYHGEFSLSASDMAIAAAGAEAHAAVWVTVTAEISSADEHVLLRAPMNIYDADHGA